MTTEEKRTLFSLDREIDGPASLSPDKLALYRELVKKYLSDEGSEGSPSDRNRVVDLSPPCPETILARTPSREVAQRFVNRIQGLTSPD